MGESGDPRAAARLPQLRPAAFLRDGCKPTMALRQFSSLSALLLAPLFVPRT
eukprot:SAG31_NODE_36093_length_316_cov_1.188940_1_plen_51_part_10